MPVRQPHARNGTIFFTDQKTVVMKKAYLTLLVVLTNILLFAQEKTTQVDVDINKGNGGNWYASPWVWIVGAAVFILLLVALTSGSRSSSDKVVEKRTVIRDSDV
jgi:hypothetical protein